MISYFSYLKITNSTVIPTQLAVSLKVYQLFHYHAAASALSPSQSLYKIILEIFCNLSKTSCNVVDLKFSVSMTACACSGANRLNLSKNLTSG